MKIPKGAFACTDARCGRKYHRTAEACKGYASPTQVTAPIEENLHCSTISDGRREASTATLTSAEVSTMSELQWIRRQAMQRYENAKRQADLFIQHQKEEEEARALRNLVKAVEWSENYQLARKMDLEGVNQWTQEPSFQVQETRVADAIFRERLL